MTRRTSFLSRLIFAAGCVLLAACTTQSAPPGGTEVAGVTVTNPNDSDPHVIPYEDSVHARADFGALDGYLTDQDRRGLYEAGGCESSGPGEQHFTLGYEISDIWPNWVKFSAAEFQALTSTSASSGDATRAVVIPTGTVNIRTGMPVIDPVVLDVAATSVDGARRVTGAGATDVYLGWSDLSTYTHLTVVALDTGTIASTARCGFLRLSLPFAAFMASTGRPLTDSSAVFEQLLAQQEPAATDFAHWETEPAPTTADPALIVDSSNLPDGVTEHMLFLDVPPDWATTTGAVLCSRHETLGWGMCIPVADLARLSTSNLPVFVPATERAVDLVLLADDADTRGPNTLLATIEMPELDPELAQVAVVTTEDALPPLGSTEGIDTTIDVRPYDSTLSDAPPGGSERVTELPPVPDGTPPMED